MSSWQAFEEDPEFVRQEILRGNLDWVEVVSQLAETEFFRYMLQQADLQGLAQSYPTPRKRHDVPLWVYLCSQLTLRLHGALRFGAYPYVVHCGGLKEALEPGQLRWKQDPKTGKPYLDFEGYNDKNDYARQPPCDKDYLRKMARDTDAEGLMRWLGTGVAKWYKQMGAYDAEGIFVVDGSYLFVPDNDRYEGSAILRFDQDNHPVDRQKLSPEELSRTRLRRCYRMVNLIHLNRARTFRIYTGVRVGSGKMGESPQLLPLVEQQIQAVGKGVMKKLIHDRGFIDGETTGVLKNEYDIESVFALRRDMDVYREAWTLAQADGKPWQVWKPPEVRRPEPPQRPQKIRRREAKRQETLRQMRQPGQIPTPVRIIRVEMKRIPQIALWESCPVPIDAVVLREYRSDGTRQDWAVGTTERGEDPEPVWRDYELRDEVEEGHRQGKCFWNLTGFRSPCFSLVVNQVVTILLAYSLFQVYLDKSEPDELGRKTRRRMWESLLPQGQKIAAYVKDRAAFVGAAEYTDWVLAVEDGARRRLRGNVRRIRRQKFQAPELPPRS